MNQTISKTFQVIAIPQQIDRDVDVWVGTWTAPGLSINTVKDSDGISKCFGSAELARIGAMEDMFRVLNEPRTFANQHQGKKKRYTLMTGPEFAVKLTEAKIGPGEFAWMYGTHPQRIFDWIDTGDVPHPARLLLEIFIDEPSAAYLASGVTEAVTTERRPERK